jgi:cobalt-zinc-cadmium efflux system protein
MSHSHHHHHGHFHSHDGHGHHHHHHFDVSEMSEKKLWYAVIANMGLTLVQVVGGIVSGSLALIADALHNFSDAMTLVIALVAVRIGRRPPDQFKTFGYKRAETIAALINLTTLVLLGFYLIFEAVMRFYAPEPILGWVVITVAGIALLIDLYTAALIYAHSKNSMNMRAAFLHNLTDAAASVGVILSGVVIVMTGWVYVDAIMTLLIAGYVLWHGFHDIPKVIHLLMEGTPHGIEIAEVIEAMEATANVQNVHHVHIWQIDERRNALEAHVALKDPLLMDVCKREIKSMLHEKFSIDHSTLEFETEACGD